MNEETIAKRRKHMAEFIYEIVERAELTEVEPFYAKESILEVLIEMESESHEWPD